MYSRWKQRGKLFFGSGGRVSKNSSAYSPKRNRFGFGQDETKPAYPNIANLCAEITEKETTEYPDYPKTQLNMNGQTGMGMGKTRPNGGGLTLRAAPAAAPTSSDAFDFFQGSEKNNSA